MKKSILFIHQDAIKALLEKYSVNLETAKVYGYIIDSVGGVGFDLSLLVELKGEIGAKSIFAQGIYLTELNKELSELLSARCEVYIKEMYPYSQYKAGRMFYNYLPDYVAKIEAAAVSLQAVIKEGQEEYNREKKVRADTLDATIQFNRHKMEAVDSPFSECLASSNQGHPAISSI